MSAMRVTATVPRRSQAGSSPARRGAPRRRPWLAAYAAQLSLGAYGGAVGLITGTLELPIALERRLPFDSPVLGAVALTILVAVPSTAVAVMAWRGHRLALHAAVLDGVLLIGWILVELAFIREVSFLHPFYVAVGAGLVIWGRSAIPELREWLRRPDRIGPK